MINYSRCVLCGKRDATTRKFIKGSRWTLYNCSACKVPLCRSKVAEDRKSCFELWHSQQVLVLRERATASGGLASADADSGASSEGSDNSDASADV